MDMRKFNIGKKEKSNPKQVCIIIRGDLAQRFKDFCNKESKSRTKLVTILIENYLKSVK